MKDRKFLTQFWEKGNLVWACESYIIGSHEEMVEWIENGIHPGYTYR